MKDEKKVEGEGLSKMKYENQKTKEEASFDAYLGNLEEKEQPEACSIDNEDCEACGS